MTETNPWKVLSTEVIYDNPWMRVREDQVVRPDGLPGIYGTVHYKNLAVGVLAVDSNGWIHLVGQYRYPLGIYSWEIPEGGCPEGEEPLVAARRELLEETGAAAREWKYLGRAFLSNCIADELAMWYLATDLTEGTAQPEGTEVLSQRKVPFEEALAMVERGEITDALTILALNSYALHLIRNASITEGAQGFVPVVAGLSSALLF